jgi:hypothetical protein
VDRATHAPPGSSGLSLGELFSENARQTSPIRDSAWASVIVSSPQLSPIIITLIHGTFDRNAPWTQDGSLICKSLKQEVGDNLYLHRFNWSGSNRQEEREVAVYQLIDHLKYIHQYFPSRPHFLVGHSHGGNLISWALRLAPLAVSQTVTAAATVSTPFLDIRRRDVVRDLQPLLFMWRWLMASCLSLLWIRILSEDYSFIVNSLKPFLRILQVPGVFIILFGPMYIVYRAARHLSNSVETRAASYLEKRERQLRRRTISLLPSISQPFLCIYTKTGEVNLIFNSARSLIALSRLTGEILRFSRLIYITYLRGFLDLIAPILGLCGALVILVIFIGDMAGHEASKEVMRAYVDPLLIVALFVAAGIPITMVIGVYLFGAPRALDLLEADISHSLKPRRISSVTISAVPSRAATAYIHRRNTHTGIMYSEVVALRISRFIKSVLQSI